MSKAISCCTKGKCFGHAKNVTQTANSVDVREIESAATGTPSNFLIAFCGSFDVSEFFSLVDLIDIDSRRKNTP